MLTRGGSNLSWLVGWGVLVSLGLEFPGKKIFQTGMGLGIRGFSDIVDSIQDLDHRSFPPFLTKFLFPNLVQVLIGVLFME